MTIFEIYELGRNKAMKFMMYVKAESKSEVEAFISNEKIIFPKTNKYKVVQTKDDILDISKPYEYVGCPRHRVPTPEGDCPVCNEEGILMVRNVG